MTFGEYQKLSRKTAQYPKIGESLVYPVLGLAGEAGEVAEKIKKLFRNKNGDLSQEYKLEIAKELGDVLWYLSQISTELNLSLEEVAQLNLEKLLDREKRGVIKSEGDNR